MRKIRDGIYECTYCGEQLVAPPNEKPKVTLAESSGKRQVRVVTLRGVEVHRCTV
jgi:hypothetical protein